MALNAPVISGATLVAGIRNEFIDVWKSTAEQVKIRLEPMMDLNVRSDKLEEIYAYYESAPYPERWERGTNIPSQTFKSRAFRVANSDWGMRVEWLEQDRMDDQTSSLFEQGRDVGANWATLDERIFFQILQGQTNAKLLDSVPLAADGTALYSTTDGDGNDRFGVVGGNILTGAGVASGTTVRADFFDAVERFALFQNLKAEPLWSDEILDQGYMVLFNAQNMRVFAEAFIQERTVEVTQNVAATENVAATVPTNIILASGIKVTLRPTQRITDNDWFVFLVGSRRKAIFKQVRQELRENFATFENSDQVRGTKQEYIQWDSRSGYGILITYQTIQVNN